MQSFGPLMATFWQFASAQWNCVEQWAWMAVWHGCGEQWTLLAVWCGCGEQWALLGAWHGRFRHISNIAYH